MRLGGAEVLRKASAGRYLLYVLVGCGAWMCIAALLLPSMDSRAKPRPVVVWSTVAILALAALCTSAAILIYLYGSWRKFPTVSNKIAYGVWMIFESVILLGVEAGSIYVILYILSHIA